MLTNIRRALIAAIAAAAAFGFTAARADAYLNVRNAADYCRWINYDAANSIMKSSTGYGAWSYPYGQGPFDPYDYWRWNSSDVNVDIIYTNRGTNPSRYGVMYGCEIRGSNTAMYAVQVWQAGPVHVL